MTYPPPSAPYPSSPGAPPPFVVPPAKTSTTGPTIMLVFGIISLVATIVCVVLAVTSGTQLAEIAESYQTGTETVDGDTTTMSGLELTGSKTYGFGCVTSIDPAGLTVTGEGGSADANVPVKVPIGTTSTTVDGSLYETQATFTPENSGTYTLTYESDDLYSPVCVVSEHLSAGSIFDSVVVLTFSIIGAVAFFVVGIGLTIGGAVWLSTRRKAARRAQAMPGRA